MDALFYTIIYCTRLYWYRRALWRNGAGCWWRTWCCNISSGFGLKPSAPSITAMLIIICVIGAVSMLQAAGGLDYLVRVAEKLLR